MAYGKSPPTPEVAPSASGVLDFGSRGDGADTGPMSGESSAASAERIEENGRPSGPVTVSITRHVKADNDTRVLAWVHAGTALAERFEGFLGTGWIRSSTDAREWHMLYRFRDHASLDKWEESPERRWWLDSGDDLVMHHHGEKRVGIEGWFDEPTETSHFDASGRLAVPPRWKQALMIFSVFFPLSLLANWLLGPLISGWPLPLRVLSTTVLLTPLMTYLMLPLATRILDRWLHKP